MSLHWLSIGTQEDVSRDFTFLPSWTKLNCYPGKKCLQSGSLGVAFNSLIEKQFSYLVSHSVCSWLLRCHQMSDLSRVFLAFGRSHPPAHVQSQAWEFMSQIVAWILYRWHFEPSLPEWGDGGWYFDSKSRIDLFKALLLPFKAHGFSGSTDLVWSCWWTCIRSPPAAPHFFSQERSDILPTVSRSGKHHQRSQLWGISDGLKPQLPKLQVVTLCGVRNCMYVWRWRDSQDIWPLWKVSEHAATKK